MSAPISIRTVVLVLVVVLMAGRSLIIDLWRVE